MKNLLFVVLLLSACHRRELSDDRPEPMARGKCRVDTWRGPDPDRLWCAWDSSWWLCTRNYDGSYTCDRKDPLPPEKGT